MARYTREEVSKAKQLLKKFVPPGTRIFFLVRKYGENGNKRVDFFAIQNEPNHDQHSVYLTAYIAQVLGYVAPAAKAGLHTDADPAAMIVGDLSRILYGTSYKLNYEQL